MADHSKSKLSQEATGLFCPQHMAEHHNASRDFAITGGNIAATGIIIDGGLDEDYNPLPPKKGYGEMKP